MLIYELCEWELVTCEHKADPLRQAKKNERVHLMRVSQRAAKSWQASRILATILALGVLLIQEPLR